MVDDVTRSEPSANEPATQLAREAIDEARVLIKLEMALAKNELKQELKEMKVAGISFGVAGVSGLLALSLACLTVVLAIGGQWWVAFIGTGIFLLIAIVVALIGFGALPKSPMERTKKRLTTDLQQLKERVA